MHCSCSTCQTPAPCPGSCLKLCIRRKTHLHFSVRRVKLPRQHLRRVGLRQVAERRVLPNLQGCTSRGHMAHALQAAARKAARFLVPILLPSHQHEDAGAPGFWPPAPAAGSQRCLRAGGEGGPGVHLEALEHSRAGRSDQAQPAPVAQRDSHVTLAKMPAFANPVVP